MPRNNLKLQHTNIRPKHKELLPPDGGWGWMVVLGTGIISVFHLSFVLVFGLVYGDVIKQMGEGTKGSTLVANVCFLLQNFSGPFTGPMVKSTSYRTVAALGCFLSAFGIIASGFSTSFWHLIVTYGVVRGIGMGLITTSSFVAVNSYFTRKKGKAIGFSACGAGIGQVSMPYVVRYLMEEFSFRGTTLILGALCFNGLIGALLLQPVKWHMIKDKEESGEELKLLNGNSKTKREISIRSENDVREANSRKQENGFQISDESKPKEKSFLVKFLSSMDLNLLKNYRFVVVIIGNAVAFSSVLNFTVISPFLMMDMFKFTSTQTTIALSVMSGADIIGRLILPVITDRFKIKPSVNIIVSCIFLAIIRQVMTFSNLTFEMVMFLCILNGLGKTIIVVNQNLSVSEQCRQDQVPSAVGLYMLSKAFIVLPSGYLIGWIRDYTGSFVISVTMLNVMVLIVVAMWLPPFIYDKYRERRNLKNTDIILKYSS